ncbi:putative anaphase-promoting complex subunit [Globisporangium polare]
MADLHDELAEILAQLRDAVRELRMRGLKQAVKFASELVLGIPDELRAQLSSTGRALDRYEDSSSGAREDLDRYEAAKASFDVGEYLRAHQMLAAAPAGKRTHFLKHYALYMAGEKAKEEMDLEIGVTGAKSERDPHRNGANPHLKELYLSLSSSYQQNELDAFGLYLYAVVLKRLGYRTSAGRSDLHSATSTPTRHPQQQSEIYEEEKSSEQHKRRSVDGFTTIAATANTNDVTTRFILVESIRQYPWNWSAWMELASLSPFTSNEEEVVLSESCPWMFHLFQAHALLDQQQNDAARQLLDHLATLFPHSTYLVAQQALTSYHMRDFDQAQEQFERLALADPHRVETMDVYSNVLYVKEDKTELSRLAHRALKVEKYRPETCCIIGNYYSLKNKHDRAIVYFHRALKLDPNFLSAWTLIGHEYVEMKNTSAAIEAYRHAVDLNIRDYRAWYGLGQAYEILNMYLYSIYYYRKAASIRPYDARMWCALGGCYEKLNKTDEAIACFQRAVGNQDREGIASYHLGRIFALRSQQHEAAKYYQLHLGLRQAPAASLRGANAGNNGERDDEEAQVSANVLVLPRGGMNISVDTPQALAAILFLANYYKQMGKYNEAALFCNRLLDLQGPEKEEAKALLREMRSLEAAKARAAGVASLAP